MLWSFYPFSTYQQTMRIDTIWGTGLQGTVIRSFYKDKFGSILRQNSSDLIDLISKALIKDGDGKRIALGKFIKIGKQP